MPPGIFSIVRLILMAVSPRRNRDLPHIDASVEVYQRAGKLRSGALDEPFGESRSAAGRVLDRLRRVTESSFKPVLQLRVF